MTRAIDLRAAGIAEARRLEANRQHLDEPSCSPGETLFHAVRPQSGHDSLAFCGLIFFFHIRSVDGLGRLLEDVVLPVRVPARIPATTGPPALRKRLRRLVARHESRAVASAFVAAAERSSAIQRQHREWLSLAATRERRIAQALDRDRRLVQPTLFHRRPIESNPLSSDGDVALESERRLKAAERSVSGVSTAPPALVLVLLVNGGPAS